MEERSKVLNDRIDFSKSNSHNETKISPHISAAGYFLRFNFHLCTIQNRKIIQYIIFYIFVVYKGNGTCEVSIHQITWSKI